MIRDTAAGCVASQVANTAARECKPVLIFQTRVYGFDRIQTRVPGYPGLTYGGLLVSGRLAYRVNSYAAVR